jgi:hypothetical protein
MYHGFLEGKQASGIPEFQANLVPYPRTFIIGISFFFGTSSYSALPRKPQVSSTSIPPTVAWM